MKTYYDVAQTIYDAKQEAMEAANAEALRQAAAEREAERQRLEEQLRKAQENDTINR